MSSTSINNEIYFIFEFFLNKKLLGNENSFLFSHINLLKLHISYMLFDVQKSIILNYFNSNELSCSRIKYINIDIVINGKMKV